MAHPHLILLGAPGSGKGTQAKKIVSELGYNHISTGDLLRGEVAKGTELGKRVEEIMKTGGLVDDQLVLELLKANCDLENSSYIFDGFPRNGDQAKMLDDEVLGSNKALAISFEMDNEKIVERIINRRTAKGSGEIYNLITRPPKVEGKCDVSGEELIHRADDKEDVVRNRLQVFENAIEPMLNYYDGKGILVKVDADRDPVDVFEDLKGLIAR
jgi:adenylate kinase